MPAIITKTGEAVSAARGSRDQELHTYPSRPIEMTRGSLGASVWAAVNRIYEIIRAALPEFRSREGPVKSHLNVVLCNLLHLHEALPTFWVRFPRSPNRYRYVSRYHPFGCSHRHMTAVVDGLEQAGLIVTKKGFYDREREFGRQSIMRATPDLVCLLKDTFGVTRQTVAEKYTPELIRLRDREKRPIDYEETEETIRMRSVVEAYNSCLGNHEIILELPDDTAHWLLQERPADFSCLTYHRVFNNESFRQGGRFYGPWWQNLKKDLRPHIRIDSEQTIGLDYSAMHIHLLYSLEGVAYETVYGPGDDPYTIEMGDNLARKALKVVLLIALNCTDKTKAFKAMRNELRDAGVYWPGMDMAYLMDMFSRKHHLISHHLYSGIGLHLQWVESTVSESVIMEMTNREIPALNIHDCFAVQSRYRDLLNNNMAQAFENKGLLSIPTIKQEY